MHLIPVIRKKLVHIWLFFFDSNGTTPYYGALMSDGTPLQRLPRKIDPRKLAQLGVVLEGLVLAENLDIFAQAAHIIGGIKVRLAFSTNEQHKRLISGSVDATVKLECQRCLQLTEERALHSEVSVAVVWDEEQAKNLPIHIDPWIVGEDDADLYALIEEELLLSLPVAAYHDYSCVDESFFSRGDITTGKQETGSNPFSVLAGIKNRNPKD
ncbi:MAG: hypothetical protein ACI9Y1_000277 [Lentisphaeria bacterium]|jgi:uncharacterized protein